jgi:predicted O-methyltransferase YrrM
MFLVLNYLKYRLRATSEHGVHSPFVYDLITKVIYNKTAYYSYKNIESLREQLLNSDKKINCIDLGAGSKMIDSNGSSEIKKINHIVKYSAKPAKYSQLLFRLVNYFQPSQVIELGTSLGISTSYLASANSKINVITVEGCPAIAEIANKNFKQLGLKNIEQKIGNFDTLLPLLLNKMQQVDFIFFDGNHTKEATLNYFNQCLPKTHENSVFIFDDIYWSDEMKQAWTEIKNNAKVIVTVDLFFMGIVFFRKEQVKQHFVIKF